MKFIIVVCIALAEEVNMSRRDRDTYLKYKEGAPFMFPVPNSLASLATATVRLLFGKNQPESMKEIIGTFAMYTLIFILLSLPFVLLNWPPGHEWWRWPAMPSGPGPTFQL